jgi:hypothetical protein
MPAMSRSNAGATLAMAARARELVGIGSADAVAAAITMAATRVQRGFVRFVNTRRLPLPTTIVP